MKEYDRITEDWQPLSVLGGLVVVIVAVVREVYRFVFRR